MTFGVIASLLSIKIRAVIDNSNNEIRGGEIKRDAGGDESSLPGLKVVA